MASKASPARPARRSRVETPTPDIVILGLYLVGIYTNIFLFFSESVFIPNVFALTGAALMMVTRPGLYENRLSLRLAALLALFAASAIIANSGWGHLPERVLSLVQIVSAFVAAHAALLFMSRLDPAILRKLFLGCLVFIVIGCLLEALTPFKAVSDAFREAVYSNRWLYGATVRDMEVYGAVRPKLFTQEPSHVAKAFLVFGVGWFLLSRHKYRLPIFGALVLVTLLTLRSPFVVLAVPLAAVLDRMVGTSKERASEEVGLVTVFALTVFTVALLASAVLFPARRELIATGEDMSLFLRLAGPLDLTGDVLGDYPLFGVGLGAKEFLWPYLRDSFGILGTDRYLATIYTSLSTNGLANLLISFGLIGTATFFFLLWRYYRPFGLIVAFAAMVLVLTFINLEGGFEGARMWGYITICLSAFIAAHRNALKYPKRKISRLK